MIVIKGSFGKLLMSFKSRLNYYDISLDPIRWLFAVSDLARKKTPKYKVPPPPPFSMVRTIEIIKGIIGYEVFCNISTAEPTKYSFTKKDIEANEKLLKRSIRKSSFEMIHQQLLK